MNIEIGLEPFYSQGDERRFFQGLRGLSCIKRFEGVGVNLLLSIEMKALTNDHVRELIALLWRYGISLSPLFLLTERKRFAWLLDSNKFWYKSITDETTRTRSRSFADLMKRRELRSQ